LGTLDPESSGLRLTSTFIEQGVFTSSVSLGKSGFGTGLESGGTWDAFRKQTDTPSGRFGGHQVGGVAGVRVSGDTQLWITNVRALKSSPGLSTALIRRSHAAENWNTRFTGPVQFSGEGRGTGHIPSGYAASRSVGTISGTKTVFAQQEATVSIALTRADWQAFQIAIGRPRWPLNPSSSDTFRGSDIGDSARRVANAAIDAGVPIPAPFLNGC
jgi:hypothetical protein